MEPPDDVRSRRLAHEASFRRAGLPLFIEDYSAYEDIFTRAVPFLGLIFFAQLLGAVSLDWPLWANALAVGVGLAILLGGLAAVNHRRGRPTLSVPDRVGRTELGAFLLLPALLPLLNGQAVSAVVTALTNAVILGLVYVVVGLGVISIVLWAGRRLLGQLAASLLLLTRAVPVLLVFMIVLFVNTEMWQVFSDLSDAAIAGITALFLLVGSLFIAVRLPRDVRGLEHEVGAAVPLRRAQMFNVGLVMFISQALQVLLVAVLVGAFFVAFGALAITDGVIEAWISRPPEDLGEGGLVSVELLKVSGGLAAFSGLYYTIAVLTDSSYREEFLDELTTSMRTTFAERAEYLAADPSKTKAA